MLCDVGQLCEVHQDETIGVVIMFVAPAEFCSKRRLIQITKYIPAYMSAASFSAQ